VVAEPPSYFGAQPKGRFLEFIDAYDYEFTQKTADVDRFTIGYIDFERKPEKRSIFGAITYFEGKLSQDKIDLKSDASSLRVLPAKPGYLAIIEYFKKEKKLEYRLEPINY